MPGANLPLYLAGARMLTNHPTSIVAPGVALNIKVQSCNGSLEFGAMACARAMPQIEVFIDAFIEALRTSHAELPALASKLAQKTSQPAAAPTVERTPAPRPGGKARAGKTPGRAKLTSKTGSAAAPARQRSRPSPLPVSAARSRAGR